MFRKEEPSLTIIDTIRYFLIAHWRGVLCVVVPTVLMSVLIPFPGEDWQWCAYCLILMAIFWVSECIPLAVTAFFPVLIFPMAGVMNTSTVCKCYINDTVILFIGSIMMAYAVEQSGLHKRLAYCAIRLTRYSHVKLLLALCIVTTFISMWITNTATTIMMIPIIFAVLKVFEDQYVLKIYEKGSDGERVASDITLCYFCAIAFSATIGGIGTLVGTATNLVSKGLYVSANADAEDYLSFPKFSMFTVPLMIVAEALMFLYLATVYLGLFRADSPAAKSAKIPEAGKLAAKRAIDEEWKKLGRITFWEIMVIFLFLIAILGFFNIPFIFSEIITKHFEIEEKNFVRDSAIAMLVVFLMILLPSTLGFFKNCTAKHHEGLSKGPLASVLQWRSMNMVIPYSFMFLLGGGFALSEACKTTKLNDKIGEQLKNLKDLPNILVMLIIIVLTCFMTNFASNVAVCYIIVPIAMALAKEIEQNQLWYNIAAGLSSSYCFMIPVGTPGNLIIQIAASIPTKKMIKAGAGPTVSTIFVTWLAVYFYAPIIWPSLRTATAAAASGDGGGA